MAQPRRLSTLLIAYEGYMESLDHYDVPVFHYDRYRFKALGSLDEDLLNHSKILLKLPYIPIIYKHHEK